MQDADRPTRIPLPFANNAGGAYKNVIPTASQIGITNGAASYYDGFPPLNFVPISAGGYPPRGSDFNGLLNQLSAGIQWLQAGGFFPYDATFVADNNGYPMGAILPSVTYIGLLWQSTADDNPTDPDAGGANWLPFNRWRITADTTFYVNTTTGDDTNSGLSISEPFATINKATSVIENFVDLSGFIVTVRIAAGTYTFGIEMAGRLVGSADGAGSVVFEAIDGVVNITTTTRPGCAVAINGAAFTLFGDNFVLSAGAGTGAIVAAVVASEIGSTINIEGDLTFGISRDADVYAGPGSQVRYGDSLNETLTDDTPVHWWANYGLISVSNDNLDVTLVGTPAHSIAYAKCTTGLIQAVGLNVLSGSATGPRYTVTLNGTINTNSGGANYFPGNSAGSDATGGIYA